MGGGMYLNAIGYFPKALTFNTNNAELNYLLGDCHLNTIQKTKSIDYFEKSLSLDPNMYPDIKFKMAKAYHLHSDFDKYTLRPESYPELANLLKFMNDYPTVKIEISGHTDNKGTAAYNKTLSENRAKAVVDYLISKGIFKDRMVSAGFGFDKPVASNDTEEGRQLNRRTEFKILEK